MAGYDEKTFSNMMTGRKMITDSDIIAISNALMVSPNELFSTEDPKRESLKLS